MRGNDLIFPEASAPVGDISAMIFQAMQQHENYRKGVLAACRTFYRLDLHTLQHLRKLFAEPTMRYQSPKGPDFAQGEAYILARIDEVLANAIELAGGPEVRPEPTPEAEPEIPWGKLPEWVQWVAMDRNNEWWGYEKKPKTNQLLWVAADLMGRCVRVNIYSTAPDWRTSLRQRPKSNDK